MQVQDHELLTYDVRETIARFETAEAFETAVEALENSGIRRDRINMIASHDAVQKKLGHVYASIHDVEADQRLPQTIYEDKRDLRGEKALAVGLPVYIGGAGAGIAVVASGGTLAFGALIAAAGAAVGAGIGSLIAHALGERHARFLQDQLELGALLITVEVETPAEEEKVTALLAGAGGHDINTHTLTRSQVFDKYELGGFDPYPMGTDYF